MDSFSVLLLIVAAVRAIVILAFAADDQKPASCGGWLLVVLGGLAIMLVYLTGPVLIAYCETLSCPARELPNGSFERVAPVSLLAFVLVLAAMTTYLVALAWLPGMHPFGMLLDGIFALGLFASGRMFAQITEFDGHYWFALVSFAWIATLFLPYFVGSWRGRRLEQGKDVQTPAEPDS